MSKLDDLIKEYDITEIEYIPLRKVFKSIRNGFVGTVTGFFSNETEGIRYLEGKNIHNGRIIDEKNVYVTREFDEKHKNGRLTYGAIVMVQSGHVGESAVITEDLAGSNCHALIIMDGLDFNLFNPFFINYYFQSKQGQRKLSKFVTGGTIKHINSSKMKDFEIPVLPLPVQDEIVRILDKYTELENELEKELEMRKKQYEYYRDKLLTFE